jgi:hypothetical protein
MTKTTEDQIRELKAERDKLLRALYDLIPWAGESPSGPPWVTDAARKRNREMCAAALATACDCFPVVFNGDVDALIASKH